MNPDMTSNDMLLDRKKAKQDTLSI